MRAGSIISLMNLGWRVCFPDDAQNLQDALRDKLYHVERYRQFAQEAEQDGDKRAATLFEVLMEDDQAWIRKLKKAVAETRKTTEHS